MVKLATLVSNVPDQQSVYDICLAEARKDIDVRKELKLKPHEKSPEDQAVDGVAHYVFNTLRGAYDQIPMEFEVRDDVEVPIAWESFDNVLKLIKKKF